MTRDEAIELKIKVARQWACLARHSDADIRGAAAQAIDGYVALGMLKLDEPKSAEDQAIAFLDSKLPEYTEAIDGSEIANILALAGFKIVEK
jgi:hypothetical protein